MFQINLRRIIPIFFLCLSTPLWATPSSQPVVANQPSFNPKEANKTFDQLNLKLSVEDLNIQHLEAAIAALTRLISEANLAINFNQKKLTNLDNVIKEADQHLDKETAPNQSKQKSGVDLVYIEKEQKNLADKIAQSRLFIIRVQEAIDTYQMTVTKLKKNQVLKLGLPLWSLLERIEHDPSQRQIDVPNPLPIPELINTEWSRLAGISMICAIISALCIRELKRGHLTQRLLRVQHIGGQEGVWLFLCLLSTVLSGYFTQALSNQPTHVTPVLIHLIFVGCGYLWALALINTLFKTLVLSAACYRYALDSQFFRNTLIFILSYYAISQIGILLIQIITISNLFWQLLQIIFHLMVVLTAIAFLLYGCHAHRHIPFIQAHGRVLKWGGCLLLVACSIPNILGYHELSLHLTYASITSFAVLCSMLLFMHAIKQLYWLCTQKGPLYTYFLGLFGYKPGQTMIEFLILRIALQLIVLSLGCYLIGQSWGYGSYYINSAYTQLLNGIAFSTFTFYPTRAMAGFIVFCLLNLCFRSLSTKLSRHAQFEEEEETQVALASILTYIGFSCAVVSGLLISGIDFTGLAIVAGALSVGIGLGLQSIVNNFVSGIILLIEKPIKPGDRISIDGLEGVVKKIRVRSTQITTPAREDIIIPNSDLITHPVTNFMYSDQYLSIYCEVGVTYDSDPVQIKNLLLQAVSQHDEIIKSARAKPNVFFHKFGESAMVFQVWFLIKDGNKKSMVRSDIHFKIDQLFREHHVKIAHPQREVTLKTP